MDKLIRKRRESNMKTRTLTLEIISEFQTHLYIEEKSTATVEKYTRDVRAFFVFCKNREITKELVAEYKQLLIAQNYAVRSINSMLASMNALFDYLEWQECKVKNLREQKKIYCEEEKELTKEEYFRLLEAARQKPRINLILQTICGTGIRISELSYFTVERVRTGEVEVSCKNKNRTILLPRNLQKLLLEYAKKMGIKTGVIFQTKNGRPMNRSNIWAEMKKLCDQANVLASKVFPHNLRKLFAKTFYKVDKDIAKLADILGHSSINTTRIYIMTSGKEHREKIECLGLVVEKMYALHNSHYVLTHS